MDLTMVIDVVDHMLDASSKEDWDKRCSEVREANGGKYPSFWQYQILDAGIGRQFTQSDTSNG